MCRDCSPQREVRRGANGSIVLIKPDCFCQKCVVVEYRPNGTYCLECNHLIPDLKLADEPYEEPEPWINPHTRQPVRRDEAGGTTQ